MNIYYEKGTMDEYLVPSKFKPGTNYKKPPKLMELHQELLKLP